MLSALIELIAHDVLTMRFGRSSFPLQLITIGRWLDIIGLMKLEW